MEVFCLTPQKTPVSKILLGWLCLVLAILSFLGAGMISPFLMILPIVFGFAFYYLALRGSIEYECSYFDGDIRFAKIRAKSSRKNLKEYRIEDVITIAPAGDRSVYRYENDKQIKVYDYTSKTGAPYYDMIIHANDQTLLYKVELDEAYLKAVCIKNAMKVVRRKE